MKRTKDFAEGPALLFLGEGKISTSAPLPVCSSARPRRMLSPCAPGDGEGFIWVKKKKEKKVIKTGVHFPGGGWAPGEGDGSESRAEHIRSCFLLWLRS